MQLLAKDGIYLRIAPRAVQQGVLHSGNRADLLLNCPAGNYTFESTILSNPDNQALALGDPITLILLRARNRGYYVRPTRNSYVRVTCPLRARNGHVTRT